MGIECFLTSDPFLGRGAGLNPANGLVDALRKALPYPCAALFICSDPDDPAETDAFAAAVRANFLVSGFSFSAYTVLDRRNEASAPALVAEAGLIILAGGHVPTQNAFFRHIRLQELLEGFSGVVLGISAGTMNSAETVYAHVELPGEAVDPDYRRFLPGLGLTKTMLLPHYQAIKNDVLDGLRVMEDVAYPDSMGRAFYALADGSYLHCRDGGETLHGEAWRIQDGSLQKLCEAEEAFSLYTISH